MTKLRLMLWILIAWPLPALIAGALGWKGVWGSGSAFVDYIIPIPVAGGVLHMPSFALSTIALFLLPSLGQAGASRLRALILGVGMAGVLWLLKLPDISAGAANRIHSLRQSVAGQSARSVPGFRRPGRPGLQRMGAAATAVEP